MPADTTTYHHMCVVCHHTHGDVILLNGSWFCADQEACDRRLERELGMARW